MKDKIKAKITLGLPLTERERAYAILYMGYSIEAMNNYAKTGHVEG